jgi:hypothetical protein
MSSDPFVDRVFANLPSVGGAFSWRSWSHGGNPTKEGVGVLPGSADVDKMTACIMDVDHYKGNIDFLDESRSIADGRFQPPAQVRFYQRVKLPVIGAVHHELVLTDHGDRDGWRVLAWHLLESETAALNPKQGARSAYNVGAWLLRPDAVGYALSSAPRKDDVGRLKYAAMTKGADAGAAKVLEGNIAGMKRWSTRR